MMAHRLHHHLNIIFSFSLERQKSYFLIYSLEDYFTICNKVYFALRAAAVDVDTFRDRLQRGETVDLRGRHGLFQQVT